MDANTYRRLAMRTKSFDQTPVQRLVNAALGLCGEFGEIVSLGYGDRDEALKECGDQLWYTAQACDAMDLDFSEIVTLSSEHASLDGLIGAIARIAEIAKKAMFHGMSIEYYHRLSISSSLTAVVSGIRMVLDRYGYTLNHAMTANIEKLRKRYPDGFSAEASQARVDEVE